MGYGHYGVLCMESEIWCMGYGVLGMAMVHGVCCLGYGVEGMAYYQ